MVEDQFPIGQRVIILGHFPELVVLKAVRAPGNGYECCIHLLDGTPDEAILSSEEAAAVLNQKIETTTEFRPVDAEKLRLLIELARIRLACVNDRHFAVSISGIYTLSHQIKNVYLRILLKAAVAFSA